MSGLRKLITLAGSLAIASLFVANVHAQIHSEKVLLLESHGSDFLLPEIESTLRKLVQECDEFDDYSRVLNLSELEEQKLLRVNLKYVRGLYGENPLENGVQDSLFQFDNRIRSQIQGSNLYLRIKINKLQELIEYQFKLFATFSTDGVAVAIKDSVIQSAAFFLDPRIPGYKNELKNQVSRFFQDCNTPPVVELKVNDKSIHRLSDTIHISPKDTVLIFDASRSYDKETTSEPLTFKWRELNANFGGSGNPVGRLVFETGNSVQKLEKPSSYQRVYKIGLIVNDGKQDSEEMVVTVFFHDEPLISWDYSRLFFIRRHSIFQKKGKTDLYIPFSYSDNWFLKRSNFRPIGFRNFRAPNRVGLEYSKYSLAPNFGKKNYLILGTKERWYTQRLKYSLSQDCHGHIYYSDEIEIHIIEKPLLDLSPTGVLFLETYTNLDSLATKVYSGLKLNVCSAKMFPLDTFFVGLKWGFGVDSDRDFYGVLELEVGGIVDRNLSHENEIKKETLLSLVRIQKVDQIFFYKLAYYKRRSIWGLKGQWCLYKHSIYITATLGGSISTTFTSFYMESGIGYFY